MSNTQRGRTFQNQCEGALSARLAVSLEYEVPINLHGGTRLHKFDLASQDRTIVAECKAYAWTVSGNVPSAKITHLREAVGYLNASGAAHRYLVISKHQHPKRRETLADYFVRLNKELVQGVDVLELDEQTGSLGAVTGALPGPRPAPQPDQTPVSLGVEHLGSLRRQLMRLLDAIDGTSSREEGPSQRIKRLGRAGKIPRPIESLMLSVVSFRNEAEYGNNLPTITQSGAINAAWTAIEEWAAEGGLPTERR